MGPVERGIVIADSRVSRLHAEFSFEDGAWTLRDRDSRGGTCLGDRWVTSPVRLQSADITVFACLGFYFLTDVTFVAEVAPTTVRTASAMLPQASLGRVRHEHG